MSAPAHVTADRASAVVVGQFVNFAPVVLTLPTPTDGWLEVTAVTSDGLVVTLTAGGDAYSFSIDRLLHIGWS